MAASAVKRLLSASPLSFSRGQSSDGKMALMSQPYFGVPLSDIVRREGTIIPNLVSKTASFLLERGLDQVGIFRVSGNSKVMERLRTSFDRSGDAVLSDTIDVMAVAGLLKLFFRELPETLIPERLTQRFVAAQEASVKDPDGYVREIKRLLATLPEYNYSTLKYLTAFLVMVSREESVNKMNANALATIFGPNMFRCMSGLSGLKEQGITNCVTLEFIRKYNELFLQDGECTPYDEGFQLSDVVLSKPSVVVLRHDVRPASRLVFESADAPHRPTSSGDSVTDGGIGRPSSATASYERYADSNGKSNELSKSSQLTPMMTVIQEAIDQAILEFVFGETPIESFPESDEMPDESDNSWSLSDDDNRAPPLYPPRRLPTNDIHPSAKAVDSDSVSESETSSNESEDDNHRQRRSDLLTKTMSDGQMHDRDGATEAEMRLRRPGSGSANRNEEPVSSAAQHRATSAPSRPSNTGTKENFGQANSTTTGSQYSAKEQASSRNNNYSNRRNVQGTLKSPLVEKQAWSVELGGQQQSEGKSHSLRRQISADEQPNRAHPKESGAAEREEQYAAEFKRLTKQIHACKKKVKEFEEDFESRHGYKPMHSDRMSNKEVRRCLEELPEARRQLNELREAMESTQDDRQDEGRLSDGSRKVGSQPTIEETLGTLILKLKEKRQFASRPEGLSEMTKQEICEEKLCIQKALLHFETIHGRPSTASEKEIMHPLYDRYRRIKRLLEKMSDGSADGLEDFQSVPGNVSFVSSTTQSTAFGSKGTSVRSNRNPNPMHSPTKSHSGRNVFTVGRGDPTHRQPDPTQRRKTEAAGTRETMGRMLNDDENLNLNQLSIPRLMSELQRTKAEKKRLQLVLHNFEEEFQRENGRKIQKYDQLPLEAEYKQYKTIKAKLKLLEVLVAKHQQQTK